MTAEGTLFIESSCPSQRKVLTLGLSLIMVCSLFSFLPFAFEQEALFQLQKSEENKPLSFFNYTISLGLEGPKPLLSLPNIQKEISFSLIPPRPAQKQTHQEVLFSFKEAKLEKKLPLPSQLDLCFEQGSLRPAREKSPFWVEIQEKGQGLLELGTFARFSEDQVEKSSFLMKAEKAPLQTIEKLSTPFQKLAEAKWWGQDILSQDLKERVEIEELLEIKQSDWLVYKEGKWLVFQEPDETAPIARIESSDGNRLILEGWEKEEYVRVPIKAALSQPLKIRPEELFQAVRIRSEKQISCMLEKQCFVLKAGDWVLKSEGKWKVLRRKDQKELFLKGKTFGDLFIFEKIAQKQGKKVIQGKFFNPERTEQISIEIPAQTTKTHLRKAGKKP